MAKRNTQTRRHGIVEHVNQHGLTAVDALAQLFETSSVTIRKDLSVLDSEGLIVRQHGGAAPYPATSSSSTDSQQDTHSPIKAAIGKLAASLIGDNQKVIIDSGSTTATMVEHLNQPKNLVVMTNALSVANKLVAFKNEPTVLMTGGTWDPRSQSFQGKMAGTMVQAYNFDLAFVGAAGLDIARGTTTYNEMTQLSQAMANAASKVIVVAESAKLRNKMPNVELAWQQVAVLVTDTGLSEEAEKQLSEYGVTVLTASPNGE
ncbi:MAG: DeoR family transcriptional regulator [Aestuariibacter sp.]|uniref:DeoR/GlpR family DNA-binding transcription regulator n=1 Tax=Marisediminitalea aggregata TaxID=634436 RepID=UPI0020CF2BFE|nr:DeoR family transcriptional regulator [Marisediminitalea aggregata]MCP3864222.1 DeoR family transcriptional regulator [Aestuariibacter sp.]MCP4528209.1 DeoR family transcriptional regulator [Aestuariibacter sp.]MCP4949106.1 DeoR family transcriptional regulator [Aestuariibacter sp.]MCP9478272.1 DeoR family transcriptional regulator [Marisediminitalea aggregata]